MANYLVENINPTCGEIITTCKRYDKAMERQCTSVIVGNAHTVSAGRSCVLTQKGQSAAHCWIITKNDKEKAHLKRAGRNRDPQKPLRESQCKQPLRKPSQGRGHCNVCGAEGHRAFECPERADFK